MKKEFSLFKQGSMMTSNTFFINDVECCASGDVIHLRDVGLRKTSIPAELLNHPKIKTILLCPHEAPKFPKSIIDDFCPHVSISIFDEYNNRVKSTHIMLVSLPLTYDAML